MSQYLEDQLNEATTARDNHVANMGDRYDPNAMEQMSLLQRRVSEARQALEQARARAAAPAPTIVTTTTSISAGGNTAIVSLMAGGKGDKRVEVAVGTTLAQIIRELGWDSTGHVFKRRVGPGQSADMSEGGNYVFGPGEFEILMVPQVRGGC